MRVHKNQIVDGEPMPIAFRNHNSGMSTDWNRYATPAETQRGSQAAQNYGVIVLGVGDVRSIPDQKVVHEPVDENRAHTEVFGDKDAQVRVKLGRIYRWSIRCLNLT